MMSGYRRVAVAEEFYGILQQVHNKDCLHAGLKKTFARVCWLLNFLTFAMYSTCMSCRIS